MKLHELSPAKGSVKRSRRIGRGHGSGWGKTSARGHKGQKSRSGYSMKRGFEGGQRPLQQRVPKRGFVNIFATKYAIVNVSSLDVFNDGDIINADMLLDRGIIRKELDGVKILGNGELVKKLTVKVAAFSETAKTKIEKAGGKTEVI